MCHGQKMVYDGWLWMVRVHPIMGIPSGLMTIPQYRYITVYIYIYKTINLFDVRHVELTTLTCPRHGWRAQMSHEGPK